MSISEIGPASDQAVAVVERPVLAPAPAAVLDATPRRVWRLLLGESRSGTIQRALVAADALAVVASMALALMLASPDARVAGQLMWSLVYLPVVLVLFKLYGLYDRDRKRLNHSTLDDVPGVFHAALLATLVLWGVLRVAPEHRLVLLQALLLLGLTIVLVLGARARVRRSIVLLVAPERVLLVGSGPSAHLLARKLARGRAGRSVRPVGYLREDEQPLAGTALDLACLGTYDHLVETCRDHAVDRVMIASSGISHEDLADLVRDANHAGVKVSLVPSAIDVLGPSTELDDFEGMMLLAVNPARFSWSSRALKRSVDVVVAAAGLPVLALALPIVAVAIKLDSPGPVFFRQERLGRGGRRFGILKLRTMIPDAEARVRDLQSHSAHPAWLVLDRDPRVTRLGRFLRQTSIDELPQLWNVLRGEMSLVGPRPMPPDTDRYINGWGRRRLDLTPGITGLWQVMGRASLSFEEMIKLDYVYVTNWSVWGDMRLLLRTASVVLTRRGAN